MFIFGCGCALIALAFTVRAVFFYRKKWHSAAVDAGLFAMFFLFLFAVSGYLYFPSAGGQ